MRLRAGNALAHVLRLSAEAARCLLEDGERSPASCERAFLTGVGRLRLGGDQWQLLPTVADDPGDAMRLAMFFAEVPLNERALLWSQSTGRRVVDTLEMGRLHSAASRRWHELIGQRSALQWSQRAAHEAAHAARQPLDPPVSGARADAARAPVHIARALAYLSVAIKGGS